MTTSFILILSIASSLLGLFREGHYGDRADLILRMIALDGVILVIAVPTLAMGLFYARRGSPREIIVWLGSLCFMTYVWAPATVTIAFNAFFLGYIAHFSLSMFTLIGGITSIDLASLAPAQQHTSTRTLFAGFLGSAAVALSALWLSEIVPATLSNAVPSAIDGFGAPAAFTYVIDLGVVVPSLAVTAMWLWRDRQGAASSSQPSSHRPSPPSPS